MTSEQGLYYLPKFLIWVSGVDGLMSNHSTHVCMERSVLKGNLSHDVAVIQWIMWSH